MSGDRSHLRRFDHDEARRRHAAGESVPDLARALGVSYSAVRQVVDPEFRRRAFAKNAAWQMGASCVDCGGRCARRGDDGLREEPRCYRCSVIQRATSARPGELLCFRCREWKPDDAFPLNRSEKVARRGRHAFCRSCQTIVKREYRQATRRPCSHGCGRLVCTADRRDRDKPLECLPCARARIHGKPVPA